MKTLPFTWDAYEQYSDVELSATAKRRIMAMVREPSASAWERARTIRVAAHGPGMGTLWQCTERSSLRRWPDGETPPAPVVVRALCYAAGLPAGAR